MTVNPISVSDMIERMATLSTAELHMLATEAEAARRKREDEEVEKAYKELKRAYLAYRTLCPETSLYAEVEQDEGYPLDVDIFEVLDREFGI